MTTPVETEPLQRAVTEAMTPNGPVRIGDRVRLCPSGSADIFDLALAGRTAIVESIEQDMENCLYLAVVVEDDPGQDLGRMRKPGHRFYFKPEEVVPVGESNEETKPPVSQKRVLVAGLGNIFLGDDAFGVEVARKLLQGPQADNVRVVDFGIRSVSLVYSLLEGYDLVIILDAVKRGGEPGTLYVIEPETSAIPEPSEPMGEINGHDLDVVKVLAWVASMGGHVGKLLVVGCEPAPLPDNEDTQGLSQPVKDALDRAVELTRQLLREELTGGKRSIEQEEISMRATTREQ